MEDGEKLVLGHRASDSTCSTFENSGRKRWFRRAGDFLGPSSDRGEYMIRADTLSAYSFSVY